MTVSRSNTGMIRHHQAGLRALLLLRRSFLFAGILGLVGSLFAGLAAALSGLGSQWGWWPFRTGFLILKWAGSAGIGSALLSLAGGIGTRPGFRRAQLVPVAGIVLGLVTAGITWSWQQRVKLLPPIHDITTDTVNPPVFSSIIAIRRRAMNRTEYQPRTAQIQKAAYPDIRPLILKLHPKDAFDRALAAARREGWLIVDANAGEGRIEATATTFWFGFQDDMVVRIKRAKGGSRVDVRSASRTGPGDAETNVARIRRYLKELLRT